MKNCSNCLATAEFSLIVIISTLGVRRRPQKSSKAVLFCGDCLQELCDRQCSETLQKSVNNALTSLNHCLIELSSTSDDGHSVVSELKRRQS